MRGMDIIIIDGFTPVSITSKKARKQTLNGVYILLLALSVSWLVVVHILYIMFNFRFVLFVT